MRLILLRWRWWRMGFNKQQRRKLERLSRDIAAEHSATMNQALDHVLGRRR